MIPIAECPGGDQLCIGINNKMVGKIYYWDHNKEKLQVNTIEEMWEPVTLIYNSFFDLIMSSQELKENEEFDDSIIENIKVSNKFLSRFKTVFSQLFDSGNSKFEEISDKVQLSFQSARKNSHEIISTENLFLSGNFARLFHLSV